jgi:hypothetical protein
MRDVEVDRGGRAPVNCHRLVLGSLLLALAACDDGDAAPSGDTGAADGAVDGSGGAAADAAGPDRDASPPVRRLTREELMDPESCRDCHPAAYREWSGSMHAYAAEDPVFVAMNARGQRETNGELGDFCVQCHAPMAVRLGLTTDGLNLDEVPPHLKGVTCYFCHTVDAVTGTHNADLSLADDDVMRGPYSDPLATPAHDAAYSPLHDRNQLESSDLCGTCHDIVTPAGVHLERTFAEWKASIYADADPRTRNTCGQCHMTGRDDLAADYPGVGIRRVHDHSMPGVDIAITDFPEREAQRAAVQRILDTSILTEICVIPATGGADVELFLENLAAGHMVPSGAAHDRRVWVEMKAFANDTLFWESGVVDEGTAVSDVAAEDPQMWVMRDYGLDADGNETHMFWNIVDVETALLPAPTALDPNDPEYTNVHIPRRYRIIGETPDRITVKVKIRPIGLEVLDELVQTGDLDPVYIAAQPTFEMRAAAVTWTPDRATERPSPLSGRPALCVPEESVRPDRTGGAGE